MKKSYKKLFECTNDQVYNYLKLDSSYCTINLPKYFSFEENITICEKMLEDANLSIDCDFENSEELTKFYNFVEKVKKDGKVSLSNYKIKYPKSGSIDFRYIHFANPFIYTCLITFICSKNVWPKICAKVNRKNNEVESIDNLYFCEDLSRREGLSIQSWATDFRYKVITESIFYKHFIFTDISNCFDSLYTHVVSWSLFGKDNAKQNRRNCDNYGNFIDYLLRLFNDNQTNGIPTGSLVFGIVAEIVLSSIDEKLAEKIGKSKKVKIIRFVDDFVILSDSYDYSYKVFEILKTELLDFGFKINTDKTYHTTNVLERFDKEDKIEYKKIFETRFFENCFSSETVEYFKDIVKFNEKFSNSNQLLKVLVNVYNSITKNHIYSVEQILISLLLNVCIKSSLLSPICFSIISKIIKEGKVEVNDLLSKISTIIKRHQIGEYFSIWLQRFIIEITNGNDGDINKYLCRYKTCDVVSCRKGSLWENDKKDDQKFNVVNQDVLSKSSKSCLIYKEVTKVLFYDFDDVTDFNNYLKKQYE